MKQPNPQRRGSTRRIAGHAQQDHVRDPYQRLQKLAEGTFCPECGAVYEGARWRWSAGKKDAQQERCPACRRIADNLPAGIVTLRGPFSGSQREDLIGLTRHQEAAERAEHPLNRILTINEDPQQLVITTTDIHLPRRIGEAVKHAFHGALHIDFDQDQYFVRVDWTAQP